MRIYLQVESLRPFPYRFGRATFRQCVTHTGDDAPKHHRAPFHLRKPSSDASQSPTLSSIECRPKQMARHSNFHNVHLPRRSDMVATEALSPTHQFTVRVPRMKTCEMPSWPCSIAVEWQLSHPKGTITGPKWRGTRVQGFLTLTTYPPHGARRPMPPCIGWSRTVCGASWPMRRTRDGSARLPNGLSAATRVARQRDLWSEFVTERVAPPFKARAPQP
jgi:hypothetical protein